MFLRHCLRQRLPAWMVRGAWHTLLTAHLMKHTYLLHSTVHGKISGNKATKKRSAPHHVKPTGMKR
jgi:hypothetical protein